MIYHELDNFLVKKYLLKSNVQDKLKESLIDWHLALNMQDEEECRNTALNFLKIYTSENIEIINGEPNFADKVISIFEPLEKLLRIAISIRRKGKVRDHLNHSIRNILLSDFLISNNNQTVSNHEQQILTIAAIFHDFAYPIQKLKAVATNIIDKTLGTFLDSKGKISFSIDNPENLISLLHDYGILAASNPSYSNETKENINILYTKVLFPAIAGQGLFEAPHCLSSCVMLLILIKGIQLQEHQLKKLIEICFSIAYHDRERDIDELGNKITRPIAFLRASDELQEWDRDTLAYSFVEDVQLTKNDFFEFTFKMKDRIIDENIEKCDPQRSIMDKVQGINPIKKFLPIKLIFELPRKVIRDDFDLLFQKYVTEIKDVSIINEGLNVSIEFSKEILFKIY